jgi:hypothetical protein
MTNTEFLRALARRFTGATWTDAQLDELQRILNMNRMQIVSDAIGHLRLTLRNGHKVGKLD